MRAWLAMVAITVCISGCASKPSPPATPEPGARVESTTPEQALYDQLASGAFQCAASLDSIESALKSAKALEKAVTNPMLRDGLLDVVDMIDACGESLADYSEEPPAADKIKADFATFDDRRLKAIEAANDSLMDLREALGIIDGMIDDFHGSELVKADDLRGLLRSAMDDVEGTVTGYGGKVIDETGGIDGQPAEIRQ